MEFDKHFFKRINQRVEDVNADEYKVTFEVLADYDFIFGKHFERLVVRDFSRKKMFVYSLDITDDDDRDRLPEAKNYKEKIYLITCFHDAESFSQIRSQRVVIISEDGQLYNSEEAIPYKEYRNWFFSVYKRYPKERD
ncbi:hypothetical protein [Paenibacillus sp. LHD-38]|uniref:hypothetical protein n=1 Tax=Paenibacillus sp. LHD-38 TaxID=3072143 RepID=UPI00280F4D72|nr:hypothetical protein [Paenibacillus sp. LHD-38]MDQ8734241.1 hypothetical protein [Paenibacillus sp. LHD-38]